MNIQTIWNEQLENDYSHAIIDEEKKIEKQCTDFSSKICI